MKLAAAPTIGELARKYSVPQRTMYARLHALHEADRAGAEAEARRGGPAWVPWLYRFPTTRWHVNLSRLFRLHPEMAEVLSGEEVERRLRRVERQLEVLDAGQRAVARKLAASG